MDANSLPYAIISQKFVKSSEKFLTQKSVAFHLFKILIEWTEDNPEISMSNIAHIPIHFP